MAKVNCESVLKVLASPIRLGVVKQLMGGPQQFAALHAQLGVDQSLLSHHLKVLRDAKLIVVRREGKTACYSLASRVMARPRATRSPPA